jgi:hypothetical protein
VRCEVEKFRVLPDKNCQYFPLLETLLLGSICVIHNAGKSDGCGENGKDTECRQVLKAPFFPSHLPAQFPSHFHPFAEV